MALVESAGVINAESLAEALAAMSFVKKEISRSLNKFDGNLDIMTEEEQIACMQLEFPCNKKINKEF